MTTTVRMDFPDADPDMSATEILAELACELSDYAAQHGLVVISAPRVIRRPTGGLRAFAHARPPGNHPFPTQRPDGPAPVAACALHEDPDIWWSFIPDEQETAKRVCQEECPLLDACLAGALGRREREGIWGGHSFPINRFNQRSAR